LSVAIAVFALALQTPTPTPVASPKPAATAPVTQGTGAARPGALVLTVVNEKGEPLRDAMVTARGAVDRSGPTLTDGTITLQNMPVGTYRARISREGFITLEKEVSIRSAARTNAEAVLSAAPPPPAPPPTPSPTPTPEVMLTAAAGAPGVAKTVNIAEMADQILNSKDTTPLVSRQLGCSGVIETSLVVARDNVASHRHADVDEMVYLVAGDATLTIAEQNQTITAGWFGLVPRGQSHSLTRRGRNPMVFLLVHSGKPCAK
jgi:quercetin dioxygenase-like cupin family protein